VGPGGVGGVGLVVGGVGGGGVVLGFGGGVCVWGGILADPGFFSSKTAG